MSQGRPLRQAEGRRRFDQGMQEKVKVTSLDEHLNLSQYSISGAFTQFFHMRSLYINISRR